jgi:hypothetical protein
MQIVFYAITAIAIGLGMKVWGNPTRRATNTELRIRSNSSQLSARPE